MPFLSGPSERVLKERAVDFDELVKALEDKNRYIAAHTLLTLLTGYSIELPTGGIDPLTGEALPGSHFGEKFNGLRVDIFADGRVVIPENQQGKLILKWGEWRKLKLGSPAL
jgi:hypothetical protein